MTDAPNEAITITRSAYTKLLQICGEAWPQEACGVIACTRAVIDTVIPIKNSHPEPSKAFSFDPAEWTAAYFGMQTSRQSLVGLFHSHPSSEAVPSRLDYDGLWPASSLSYWIVSLKNPDSPYVQAYRPIRGGFEPLKLMLA